MTSLSICSECGTFSEMGKHYWHLMRCEPWLLVHHPLRDEEGEVVEPRTIDHPLGLALSGAAGVPPACHAGTRGDGSRGVPSAVVLPEPGVSRPTERKFRPSSFAPSSHAPSAASHLGAKSA